MQPNIVLLAGGSGARLWPLSSNKRPKQFIVLPSINLSSFQLALKRSLVITEAKNIIIISNIEYKDLLHQQIDDLNLAKNDFHIIFEKYSNNTGIAAYLCCLLLLQQEKDNLTYFFPTDHLIFEELYFFSNVLCKIDNQKINLFGQRVFNACSNFGYILTKKNISSSYYKIDNFIEKPDKQKIIILDNALATGSINLYQNLGIYLAKTSVLYNEFHLFCNDLPSNIFNIEDKEHYIEVIYANLPIDKMISEHSQLLNLIEIKFSWKDIGSFENLYQSCEGEGIICEADSRQITEFNQANKEFELHYNITGEIQIIKKVVF